ncbi:MAG: N,N-dimethylformamidase beta subunit family domain-containing protein, partial [Aggregatilineales bacterium]
MSTELIGYADKLGVAPGETIAFKISTDLPEYEAAIVRLIHGDINGPGFKAEVVGLPRQQAGRKQIAYCGSYAQVGHQATLSALRSLTLQMWIYPTTPHKGQIQGLLTKWSPEGGYGLVIGEGGDLGLWIGDEQRVERIYTGKALRSHQWYFVAATFDAEKHKVGLYQLPLSNWPLEKSSAIVEQPTGIAHAGPNQAPLLMAAAHSETVGNGRKVANGVYNGKIDSLRIFARALGPDEIERLRQDASPDEIGGNDLIAAWDFSADISSTTVTDTGRHQLHGIVINMPIRAVTGHNWDHTEHDFNHAPSQYGAIHFHDDDLEDAAWETDFEWRVLEETKSGFYAARLRSGEQEDYVPFFIRPRRGTAAAKVAVLAPTMTYLAYANERLKSFPIHEAGITNRPIVKDPLDLYLEEHPEFAMSIYDLHSDGSGCCYSSRLRPIVNMRPHYRMWLVGAPRHLGADLYLVDWLETKGFAYDVITDEDLHFEGTELLANYRVVLTGTHPEYWTTPMLTALQSYQENGGRLMYLGGNGCYWVTAVDRERPHVVEVRRGMAGTRAWNSAPGEQYHSATGELGGLWRHRGKAPNQTVGIGFSGMGWDSSPPGYTRLPASFDERAAFVFEGIAPDEIIGNFGLVLGGAAADELDRLDYELGSPPHALLLASAAGYSRSYLPVIEDILELSAGVLAQQDPRVRADMVYFETSNGGAVF